MYSQEHEWVLIESKDTAMIGVTDFAVSQLGDVVFVELPKIGTDLVQFMQLGEIESVKAVSELYSIHVRLASKSVSYSCISNQ